MSSVPEDQRLSRLAARSSHPTSLPSSLVPLPYSPLIPGRFKQELLTHAARGAVLEAILLVDYLPCSLPGCGLAVSSLISLCNRTWFKATVNIQDIPANIFASASVQDPRVWIV
jgi:hypothetical protein